MSEAQVGWFVSVNLAVDCADVVIDAPVVHEACNVFVYNLGPASLTRACLGLV